MILRDISFEAPRENIAFDDVLLRSAESSLSGECLRFWESRQTFIVLGRVSQKDADVYFDEAQRDNIPILRRSSGGGTVVQGKGCLNYSLILKKSNHPAIVNLHQSYQYILKKIINALAQEGMKVYFMPISDMALGPDMKKFSGNAQRRSRRYILHHGTFLYGFDLSLIRKYLRMPPSQPEYRDGRSHDDFVTNIPLSATSIRILLRKAFSADARKDSLHAYEKEGLKQQLHVYGVRYNIKNNNREETKEPIPCGPSL